MTEPSNAYIRSNRLGLLCNHSHQRGIHHVRMLRGNRDGFLLFFFLYIVSFRFRFKAETMSVVCHSNHKDVSLKQFDLYSNTTRLQAVCCFGSLCHSMVLICGYQSHGIPHSACSLFRLRNNSLSYCFVQI